MVKFNAGNTTFQEAFDRTGRIINITVAPKNHYDPPRLLNYLTAPQVCIYLPSSGGLRRRRVTSALYGSTPAGDWLSRPVWSLLDSRTTAAGLTDNHNRISLH